MQRFCWILWLSCTLKKFGTNDLGQRVRADVCSSQLKRILRCLKQKKNSLKKRPMSIRVFGQQQNASPNKRSASHSYEVKGQTDIIPQLIYFSFFFLDGKTQESNCYLCCDRKKAQKRMFFLTRKPHYLFIYFILFVCVFFFTLTIHEARTKYYCMTSGACKGD